MRALSLVAATLMTVVTLGMTPPAYAQGNGRPKAPRPETTATSPALSATPVSTYPQFGAWLDDASALGQGDAAVNIGAGYWRLAGMSQTNVPMLGGGIGVTDRFQVSASVPFYRVTAPTWSAHGLDDMYLSGKYVLLDPTLTVSEVGLAISPLVEVLSTDAGEHRIAPRTVPCVWVGRVLHPRCRVRRRGPRMDIDKRSEPHRYHHAVLLGEEADCDGN